MVVVFSLSLSLLSITIATTYDINDVLIEGELAKPVRTNDAVRDASFVPAPAGLQARIEKTPIASLIDAHAEALCVDGRVSPCVLRNDVIARPALDVALHELAWLLETARRPAESVAVYALLLRERPRSRWAPHAHLALAESHFLAAALPTARAHYEQVLQGDDASLRDYARYKLGWVAFNELEYAAAFALFVRVANEGEPMLRREALRDAVRTYAQFGAAHEAASTFAALDRTRTTWMLERLAQHYEEDGKAAEALVVLDVLDALDARSVRASCGRQLARLRVRAAWLPDDAALLEETRRFVVAFGGTCASDAERWTAELARSWRHQWRRTRDPGVAARANAICGIRAERRPWPELDACAPE